MRRDVVCLAALVVAMGCQPHPTGGAFEIMAPPRIAQAQTSQQAAFCDSLDVRLTFDRVDDVAAPPIDDEPLVAKAGSPCRWTLGEERRLRTGTYDLIVRFTGPVVSTSACTDETVLIGAYVLRGASFPFPDDFRGLTDADFFSRRGEEGALEDPSLSFDPDDDGRDNFSEVALGTDPCAGNSVPVVTVTAPTAGTEGQPASLVVHSSDADGLDHGVTLRIAHSNDLTQRADYATTELIFRSTTDDPATFTVVPDDIDRGEAEVWSLGVTGQSVATGEAQWTLTFTPDEPFVGELTLEVEADDGFGGVYPQAAVPSLNVAGVDDPTTLLFDSGGELVEATSVTFAESGSDTHRFRFQDDDLDTDWSGWAPQLAGGEADVTLSPDGAWWLLGWSPTNDDAVSPPPTGHFIDIDFFDGTGVVGAARLTLLVDPLYNDAPTFDLPTIGARALPAGVFSDHTMPFLVYDIDQVTSVPTCEVTITNVGGATCAAPFDSVDCASTGRNGAEITYAITLTPRADYDTACGSAPSFAADLRITDAAPGGASNGPISVQTQASCYGATGFCRETFTLRTSSAVMALGVRDLPGADGWSGATGPSKGHMVGTVPAGVIRITRMSPTPSEYDRIAIMDLDPSDPRIVSEVDPNEICDIETGLRGINSRHDYAAVDEVGQRVVLIGPRLGTSLCNGNRMVAVIGVADPSAPAINSQLSSNLCSINVSRPFVDGVGNIYVPCKGTGDIARIDGSGATSTPTFADYVDGGPVNDEHLDVLVDPDGTRWIVWPDNDGFLLIDTATFSDVTPTTQRVAKPVTSWWVSDIQDHVIDAQRYSYIFTYDDAGEQQLYRLRLAAGGAPSLQGPMVLANSDGEHLLLRLPGPEPASGVDLVIDSTSSYDVRPHINLDTWALVDERISDDYNVNSTYLTPSPDRRYYVGLSLYNTPYGANLYPFDPTGSPVFVALDIPHTPFDRAARITVNNAGYMTMIAGDDAIGIIYFLEAAAGQD